MAFPMLARERRPRETANEMIPLFEAKQVSRLDVFSCNTESRDRSRSYWAACAAVEVKEEVPSWPALGIGSASSLSVVSSAPQMVGIPNPLSGLHFQTLNDLRTAKSKQTLMVGAIIVLWAYGFYSRSFGGTSSDVSTIFFAAFGLDITLDALLSKIAAKSS